MNFILENVFTHAFPKESHKGRKELCIKTEYNPKNYPYQYSLYIIDNGIGLNILNKERIFEPFFKVKTDSELLGMGLYMAENIVTKKMGGKIEVNESMGGTNIAISLSSLEKKKQQNKGGFYEKFKFKTK